jgi:hypothetical protein
MEKQQKCHGLVGYITGHSFDHIYDTEKIPVNAEDYKTAITAASDYNQLNWHQRMDPSDIPTEEVTKTYKHSICKRCGLTVKQNQY